MGSVDPNQPNWQWSCSFASCRSPLHIYCSRHHLHRKYSHQIKSSSLWAHLLAAYLFTGWTCLMLYLEYGKVENMRYKFIAAQKQRPDQFTVLVRQVPRDPNVSIGLKIEHFFRENHPDHYCTHQVVYKANKLASLIKKKEKYEGKIEVLLKKQAAEPTSDRPTTKKGFLHMYGEKVDAIDYYDSEIDRLTEEISVERKKILSDDKYVMRAGFVSFNSRWGAAVCAQTQQSKDATRWLTEWAPEPRDVYWNNLSIRYVELNSRRIVVAVIVFLLVFFFLIPVTFVQSLANLDSLNQMFPFLRSLTNQKFITYFIQGFLPGLITTLFLKLLPYVLTILSKFEGHVSLSAIDRYCAIKYYVFVVVNVFFGNVIAGSIFEQFKQYIKAPPTVPTSFGSSIPMKSTFFITYIMIEWWSLLASEIFRLVPLLIYHLKSLVVAKTEKNRVKAIPATPPPYSTMLSQLCLYFLLGVVYAIISPLILPFIVIFFAFGYVVYRNQVINVYEPLYESAASFWPLIHRNIVIALIMKHITLIGLFSTKRAFESTPFLLPLPILTFIFYLHCNQRYFLAFVNYPLQEAMLKDKMEPGVDVKGFLETSYLHPAINSTVVDSDEEEEPSVIKNGATPVHPSASKSLVHDAEADTSLSTPLKKKRSNLNGDSDGSPDLLSSSQGFHAEGSGGSLFGSSRRFNSARTCDLHAQGKIITSTVSPSSQGGSSHYLQCEGSRSSFGSFHTSSSCMHTDELPGYTDHSATGSQRFHLQGYGSLPNMGGGMHYSPSSSQRYSNIHLDTSTEDGNHLNLVTHPGSQYGSILDLNEVSELPLTAIATELAQASESPQTQGGGRNDPEIVTIQIPARIVQGTGNCERMKNHHAVQLTTRMPLL
ncbi:hypothetical protein BDL97_01G174200 [Sphagnum fallax]|nr:hypothetical protein BDL97_01G174200 [Sphagnum fallax]